MLLLLLGCTDASAPASTSWADCPDPTCRHETLETAWASEPESVLAALPGLDPVEQETLVQFLLGNYPQQQKMLCDALPPDSPGGQRCARVQARPHLTQGRHRPIDSFTARKASGPSQSVLPPPKTPPPDWLDLTDSLLGDCDPGGECVREKAAEAALSGDVRAAGAICKNGASVQDESYWECLFETAEVLAAAERYPSWGLSARLCSASAAFIHGCLHHSLALALPDIPAADAFDTASISDAQQAAAAFSEAVGGHGMGILYVDRVWALWTWQSYQHASTVTGQLIAVLPQAATPHIRLAAAYRLMASRTDWSISLDALSTALTTALTERTAPATSGPRHTPVIGKQAGFWPEDLPGEEAIPAVYCAGDSRRATDTDPDTDARLAILEASGRLSPPPPADFFAAVVKDAGEPEVVRWTAARILQALNPEAAAALQVEALTPLIETRLR